MSRNPRISELSAKRSLLKSAGQFREAIPFQLELIELLEEEKADRDRLAMAHNMASVLYLRSKLYSSAERHGRQALAFYSDRSAKGHEALGAFNHVMAQILASRYEFEEAARFGEAAIAEYAHWHTPPDSFLVAIIDEVESMKNRSWRHPNETRAQPVATANGPKRPWLISNVGRIKFVASIKKFTVKGYPLRQYQEPGKIEFPRELPVAFAVCSKKCGGRQFIVDGGTQVCEYCGRSMFRTEVATYVLERKKRKPNQSSTAQRP